MSDFALHADFVKVDKKQHIVSGYATTTSVDRDGQRMDEGFLKRAFPSWAKKYGNIRYMHQPKVVGKAIDCSEYDGRGFYITAKISDPQTWEQIENGELNGFSIGVKNAKIEPDTEAPRGVITDGEIIETSVVDIPSNRDADFVLIKSATFDLEKGGWLDDMGDIDDILLDALCDDISNDDIDVYKRYYSAKERREMPKEDFGDPEHLAFPVKDQEDLDNAAKLIGHARNREAVKRRLIEIAHRKGLKLPKEWQKEEDAKKDVTLDSGLQGTNLEGQKEDKKVVADEMKTTEAVETEVAEAEVEKSAEATETVETAEEVEKTASTDESAVAEETAETEKAAAIEPEKDNQLFNLLQDIKGLMESLAMQTAHNRDGDIDFAEHNAHESQEEVATAPDFDPNNFKKEVEDMVRSIVTAELERRSNDSFKSLIAEEVSRIMAEQADTTKSLVADETKSLVADVQKKFDELSKTVSEYAERLETVEQMAQPARGNVMAIEREVKKSTTNDVLNVVQKFASQMPEEGQKELFKSLYSNITNGGN